MPALPVPIAGNEPEPDALCVLPEAVRRELDCLLAVDDWRGLGRLGATIIELLEDETRLAKMRAAAKALARPDAARDLARVLMEVAA